MQGGVADRASNRSRDDRDELIAAVQRLEQAHEVGLRLHRDDPGAEPAERAHAIPRVRPDVEGESAGRDEWRVETRQAPRAERDAVVQGERARDARHPIEATHAASLTSTVSRARVNRDAPNRVTVPTWPD
jgi:hypothetical protein